MNRIYRTVWNYATQSLVVVSELAKSNKKASAGNNVSEVCAVNSDRKSTRLNSSHHRISYAVFCLKKKK